MTSPNSLDQPPSATPSTNRLHSPETDYDQGPEEFLNSGCTSSQHRESPETPPSSQQRLPPDTPSSIRLDTTPEIEAECSSEFFNSPEALLQNPVNLQVSSPQRSPYDLDSINLWGFQEIFDADDMSLPYVPDVLDNL